MDELFKRYSDVHFLLHSMPFENLLPFLTHMFEKVWEENLWEVWVSNPFQDKGFDEFKREARKNLNKSKSSGQMIAEAKEAERVVMQAFGKEVR